MFRKYILLFCLVSLCSFSQENKISKRIHIIGGGPQFLAIGNKDLNGGEYATLKYNQPSYCVFYKILFHRKDNKYLGLTVKLNHRQGAADGGYTGLSSHLSTKGNFSLTRADIGIELGRWFGKSSNFYMGTGIYGGKIITENSSALRSTWYINSGSSYENLNSLPILMQYHVGLHFNIFQQLKLFENNYLVYGIIIQLESPEVDYSKIGKMASIIIGYKFAKK